MPPLAEWNFRLNWRADIWLPEQLNTSDFYIVPDTPRQFLSRSEHFGDRNSQHFGERFHLGTRESVLISVLNLRVKKKTKNCVCSNRWQTD